MFRSDSLGEDESQSPFTDSLKGLLSSPKRGNNDNTQRFKNHNQSIIAQLSAFKNDPDQNSSQRSSILDDDNQSRRSGGLESNSSGLVAKTADWHHQQNSSRHSILDSKYHTPSLGPTFAPNDRSGGVMLTSKSSKPERNYGVELQSSPKYVDLRDKYKGQKYFEFSDFDAYVTSMSKAIGKSDIKHKVQELKQLATSLKIIAETQSEEDMERILGQHASFIPLAKPREVKPLYKKVSEAATDPQKLKSIKDNNNLDLSNNYNSKTSADDNLRNSLTGLIHLQKLDSGSGSPVRPTTIKRAGVLGSLQTVDSHGKVNEPAAGGDTFEAFLAEQGEIGSSAYTSMINANHIKNLIQENVSMARTTESKSLPPNSARNTIAQQQESNAFSFVKQGDEPSSASQLPSEGLTANLQLFLMQNLREIMEVKGILREGIAQNQNSPEAKENIRPSDDRSENNPPSVIPQDNMNDQLQQRLQEGQMERLVNKIQVLNERVKQLEEQNNQNNFLGLFPKTCLRIGKIRMTELIDFETDFTKTSLENIYSSYVLNQKYVYIYTTHITICKDSNSAEEQGQNISLALIEQIYYLEKPGSTFFILKLLDKAHEKDWYLESVRLGAQIKPRTFENIAGFYLLEVKDPLEMSAWESVFFVLNFKAIAGNISFSSNKSEFLRALKLFVHKYIQVNGETVRPFTELGNNSNSNFSQLQNAVNQIQRMSLINGGADIGRDKTSTVDYSRRKSTATALTSQLQSFMKNRIDEGEKRDTDTSSVGYRRTLQKKSSLSRGQTPEDEISGFDNGNNTVIEENAEEMQESRERSKSQYLHNLMRKSAIDFNDEEKIFAKHLKTLLEGMVFGKYGEWGKRHERHVRLTSDLKGIEWISPSEAKKKSKALEVDSISMVVAGNKSSYFVKKKLKSAELDLCFSIVARTRSIHLQAPDVRKKDTFIEALDYILKEKAKLRRLADQAELESNKTRKSK